MSSCPFCHWFQCVNECGQLLAVCVTRGLTKHIDVACHLLVTEQIIRLDTLLDTGIIHKGQQHKGGRLDAVSSGQGRWRFLTFFVGVFYR